MNTIIASKGDIISSITNELTSKVGFTAPISTGLLVLIIASCIVLGLLLFIFCLSDDNWLLCTLFIAMLLAITGCLFINSIKSADNFERCGINYDMLKSCINTEESYLSVPLKTDICLKKYSSKDTMSIEVPMEDENTFNKAINLKIVGATFIEDSRDYIVVPCTTYKVNQGKIHSLLSKELLSQIENSARYGEVVEVHYIPTDKKKQSNKGIDNASVIVDVQTDVNVTVK